MPENPKDSDDIYRLIMEMKNDRDLWKRRDAAFALQKKTEAIVTRALIEAAMSETDSNVLEGVAVALGNDFRTKDVIPALRHIQRMEGDGYRWSRLRAEQSLKNLKAD